MRLSSHREIVDTIEGSNKLTRIEADACRVDAGTKTSRQWKKAGEIGCKVRLQSGEFDLVMRAWMSDGGETEGVDRVA